MTGTRPTCVFLFDMTRMRSHLCFRFLSTHPEIEPLWHPFSNPYLVGPERMALYDNHGKKLCTEKLPEVDSISMSSETYGSAAEEPLRAAEDAEEEGKIFMANEHCFLICKRHIAFPLFRNDRNPCTLPTGLSKYNPTYIPDSLFHSLTPVFVIRNPIFAIPSNYETFKIADPSVTLDSDAWTRYTTLRTQRHIFEYFRQRSIKRGTAPPIVIDGDDIVWCTEEVGRKVCEALEIDSNGLKEQWEPVAEEKRSQDPFLRTFLKVSDDSTGILKNLATGERPSGGLKKAVKGWEEKYGVGVAGRLGETVEGNMVDFEFMRGFKL